jgi:hypothetical protein
MFLSLLGSLLTVIDGAARCLQYPAWNKNQKRPSHKENHCINNQVCKKFLLAAAPQGHVAQQHWQQGNQWQALQGAPIY